MGYNVPDEDGQGQHDTNSGENMLSDFYIFVTNLQRIQFVIIKLCLNINR